jgi:hypothetical protein
VFVALVQISVRPAGEIKSVPVGDIAAHIAGLHLLGFPSEGSNHRKNTMDFVYRSLFLAALCVIASSAAEALPRDDVMANAYRCWGIGDSHTWLDCYYGAAQPVRGALGLRPVTESQARLIAAPPVGGAQQDLATREEVMAAAARCYVVKDDRAWLNCYYSSAQPLRPLIGLPAVPDLRGLDGAAAQTAAASKGGGTADRLAAIASASKISGRMVSHMASYSFDRDGIFTVILVNGETWQQLPGDSDYAHWKRPPETYVVMITKGALGSSNMRVQGSAVAFKVERIH